MKVVIADNAEDMSRKALALIERLLAGIAEPCVVLPTGNTPLGLYAAAVQAGPRGALARARYVQLDEYLGIAPDDRRSLARWADTVLLRPLGIGRDRLIAFDPAAPDAEAEALRVEREARRHGLDLALLGLGPNGHLGFNEPGSAFDSVSRVVPLTPASIVSNAVYWGSEADVPRQAFTLGLGTLATAKAAILLVTGAHKAAILRRVLLDPPSPEVPATCLRLLTNATVVADRAALSAVPADVLARMAA
ncbi:MAG: 6-phosphogluconolactonase [Hyphomicrobiaceae bacterium]